jgi:chemotaxis protein CheX
VTSVTAEQLAGTEAKCVVAAVHSIFASLIAETPPLRSSEVVDDVMTCNGVIGSISLVGGVEWSLMIYLSAATAPLLAERFTGFEIPFDSADMGDAVGELANLLAGELKVELDHVGIKANISLPQVFRGRGMEVLSLAQQEPMLFIFDSSCGPISLAIVSGKLSAAN